MRAAFILWIGLGFMTSSILKAQTFEDGYQSYMRNQYPVAEFQFKSALKKAKAKEDMAFILKFIGICQYMRGDKNQASASFYQALANDKTLSIDEEEVLDPSVVTFFSFLKNKWAKEGQSAAPPPAVAAAGAATPPPSQHTPIAPPKMGEPAALKPKSPVASKPLLKSGTKKKKPSVNEEASEDASPSRIRYWHFLPFGAGQFYNGSYLLGGTLALAETYALYKYADYGSIVSERKKLDASVGANEGISQDRRDAFLAENASYTRRMKKQQNLHLALFAGLWIGGALDAVLRAPATLSAGSNRETSPKAASGGKAPLSQKKQLFKGVWLPDRSGGTWLVQLQLENPW